MNLAVGIERRVLAVNLLNDGLKGGAIGAEMAMEAAHIAIEMQNSCLRRAMQTAWTLGP